MRRSVWVAVAMCAGLWAQVAQAKPSMACFDRQAACNQGCIESGDLACVQQCGKEATECVEEENAREHAAELLRQAASGAEADADEAPAVAAEPEPAAPEGKRAVEPRKEHTIHGPEQREAVAVCWQNPKDPRLYRCDGPVQDTITADEPLATQLMYAGCEKPRLNDGARTIEGKRAIVYLCGWGLDREVDVAHKYGFVVQRNHYQCSGQTGPTLHCKDNYQLTD